MLEALGCLTERPNPGKIFTGGFSLLFDFGNVSNGMVCRDLVGSTSAVKLNV